MANLEVQITPLVDEHQVKAELEHANQGLEDAYAELQSTNKELQTINDELGQRTAELNQLNIFLESIWAGLGGAVVVLDADLKVLVWNHGSEDLWGSARRSRAGTSSTWTSACPSTRSARRCARP